MTRSRDIGEARSTWTWGTTSLQLQQPVRRATCRTWRRRGTPPAPGGPRSPFLGPAWIADAQTEGEASLGFWPTVVPVCSIGFWVAMTRRRRSGWVRPDSVTCFSASPRAGALRLGGARLILSASTRLAATGPRGRQRSWGRTVDGAPGDSAGRAGVNWMREKSAMLARVFDGTSWPAPSTPSMSRWCRSAAVSNPFDQFVLATRARPAPHGCPAGGADGGKEMASELGWHSSPSSWRRFRPMTLENALPTTPCRPDADFALSWTDAGDQEGRQNVRSRNRRNCRACARVRGPISGRVMLPTSASFISQNCDIAAGFLAQGEKIPGGRARAAEAATVADRCRPSAQNVQDRDDLLAGIETQNGERTGFMC